MAKRKLHIGNSFFKAVRDWFSKKTRCVFSCLSCIGKVEDVVHPCYNVPDSNTTLDRGTSKEIITAVQKSEKPTIDLKQLLLKTVKRSQVDLRAGCVCQGSGEHLLVPSASAHRPTPETPDLSPRGSSSCTLLDRHPQDVRGSPDCRKTVLGSFHQASIAKRHPSILDGTQCTSIAFSSLAMDAVLPVGLWTPEVIDRVVKLGDGLHRQRIKDLGSSAPACNHLAADEMPRRPEDSRYLWPVSCIQSKDFLGVLYPNTRDGKALKAQLTSEMFPGHPFRELGDALARSLQGKTTGCVFTMKNESSAVIKSPIGGYVVVDSHAKDALGKTSPDGKASVTRFACVNELVTYFRNKTNKAELYSLTGFEITLDP